MEKSPQEKLEAFCDKEIARLKRKIDKIEDDYPKDIYGCKADEKANDLYVDMATYVKYKDMAANCNELGMRLNRAESRLLRVANNVQDWARGNLLGSEYDDLMAVVKEAEVRR